MKAAKPPKKKRKSGPSGPSGAHGKQLLLDEKRTGQFAEWSAEAERRKISRAEYIRLMADSGLGKKK